MYSKIPLLTLVCLVAFTFSACSFFENEEPPILEVPYVPERLTSPPNAVLTAPMVLSGYNAGWEGKPIKVKGTYMSVRLGRDALGEVGHVDLYSDTSFTTQFAHCEFRGAALDSIKTMSQQDLLQVQGKVDSTSQNLVRIVDCKLE